MIDIKQAAEILDTDDNNARVILRHFKVRTEKSAATTLPSGLTPKPKNLYDEAQVREVAGFKKFS